MKKPYKAKSLSGAERMVRQQRKLIATQNNLLNQFDYERRMLAKLAAKTPQFFNPMDAWQAESIRDRILPEPS